MDATTGIFKTNLPSEQEGQCGRQIEGNGNKILTKDYGLKPQRPFSTDKFMRVL